MKNCIRPHYEKLKPLKSGFIENSNFENNRDPWAGFTQSSPIHLSRIRAWSGAWFQNSGSCNIWWLFWQMPPFLPHSKNCNFLVESCIWSQWLKWVSRLWMTKHRLWIAAYASVPLDITIRIWSAGIVFSLPHLHHLHQLRRPLVVSPSSIWLFCACICQKCLAVRYKYTGL